MESIKCPGCNSSLQYNIADRDLQCKYCGTISNIEEEKNTDISILEDRMIEVNEAFCPECGAKLMTDTNTISAKCAYCGSSLIYNERIKAFSPKMILLFENDIEKIKNDTLKKLGNLGLKGKEELVELLKPIYLPYWIYHCEAEVLHNLTMKTVNFDNILIDASKKVKDNIADLVERSFNLNKLRKFDKSMVIGYFAEKYDVESDSVFDRAVNKMETDMNLTMPGASFVYVNSKPTYILLPFYYAKKNGEQLVVNAQSGEMCFNGITDVPVKKQAKYITKIEEFEFNEKEHTFKTLKPEDSFEEIGINSIILSGVIFFILIMLFDMGFRGNSMEKIILVFTFIALIFLIKGIIYLAISAIKLEIKKYRNKNKDRSM